MIVLGLGDFVSGLIHEELVESAPDTIIEWVLGGSLVVSQFLLDLCENFEEVEFDGIPGNHGRMTKKPRFKQIVTEVTLKQQKSE